MLEMSVEVLHTLREGNMASDFLAKKGIEGYTYFLSALDPLPSPLVGILHLDKLDLSFCRP